MKLNSALKIAAWQTPKTITEFKVIINRMLFPVKFALLPLLLAIYPPLFFYANNAAIIVLASLVPIIVFDAFLAIGLYLIFLMFYKRQPVRAALASFVILIFFNTYGIFYDILLKLDVFEVKHYTLLPFMMFLVIYASWIITKVSIHSLSQIGNAATIIMGVLVIFNVIRIIPHEIEKGNYASAGQPIPTKTSISTNQDYPDIYYFVFDEFSGFEPMRQFWHYQGVNDFEKFLRDNGFWVTEQSHSPTDFTLYELASRLNYQDYPCCDQKQYRTYFSAIADSRVTQFLKSKGYKTVAFEELKSAFPADISIQADYLYENDPSASPSQDLFLDDFTMLVLDKTMLRAFTDNYKPTIFSPAEKAHRDMIYFTANKVVDLSEIPSPKFVYVHLLLPHFPFLFDENGAVIATTYNTNWNDYLGNYIFTMKIAEKITNGLLSKADSKRPPVIILQSDHGARNQIYNNNEDYLLQNFPEGYKTSILFALYLPGYDTTRLPQDLEPVNTFPIIFNYLFHENIPLISISPKNMNGENNSASNNATQ